MLSKLDVSDSGHITEQFGQALREGAWGFDALMVARGYPESVVPPQFTPGKRQRVGEGKSRRAVPRGLSGRRAGSAVRLCASRATSENKLNSTGVVRRIAHANHRRCGSTPMGRQAFFQRDPPLPASHELGGNPRGRGGLFYREQRL